MKKAFFQSFYSITILFLAAGSSLAQNNSAAVPFLNIIPDSRSAGMGNVGTATASDGDPNALFHNPAKLAFANRKTAISINYTPWLRNIGVKDANLGYLSGYKQIDNRQTLGASLKYFSLGDVPFTDEHGELYQQYRSSDIALDISYIRNMGKNFALSLTARYTHSSLGNGNYNGVTVNPGNALSADVGLYLKKPIQLFSKEGKLAFGADISNLGTKIQYGAQKAFLPANLKIGVTADVNVDEKNVFALSLDFNKLLVTDDANSDTSLPSVIGKSFSTLDLAVGTGIEYWHDHLFALRTGYYADPGKYENQYLTTGCGLKYKLLQFDISYLLSTKSKSAIDNTLRLSLTYQIN